MTITRFSTLQAAKAVAQCGGENGSTTIASHRFDRPPTAR
jgi:hypothetical protein